jgi:hypothetical protein
VRTTSGTPVPDAQVSLAVHGEERVEEGWTDSIGRFSVTRMGSRRPPFEIRVCRDGYQSAARTVYSLEALKDSLVVVLEPRGPRGGTDERRSHCAPPFRPAT